MPHKPLTQTSFFTPEFADPGCLPEGGVGWLLRRYASTLFPAWLFAEWSGAGRRGRNAWPAAVLATTLILASREGGMPRRMMVRRLQRDTSWRAACGLDIGAETPSEKTFRRFERYLQDRHPDAGVSRLLLLHEHVVRLCIEHGLAQEPTWMMDSTPMWCFGATQDTLRMLGDGLRSLCLRWARLTGQTVEQLAAAWELPLLLGPSLKGNFRIDWKDPVARAGVTDTVASAVLTTVDRIRSSLGGVRPNKRKGLLRRCARLCKVIASDLETDADGRLAVAQKVAGDRLVSITDPQARSSRKSKSKKYKGFKVHLLGDLVSGLITAVSVTPANVGDGRIGHRLIRRALRLIDDLGQVLADTAYGGVELHLAMRGRGVDVLAPPQPIARSRERYAATDFEIDLAAGQATCPAGETVELRAGGKDRYFVWNKASCDACSHRPGCVGPRSRAKVVMIRKHHEELVELRARWEDPAVRERYRLRARGERLVNEAVRRGCRQARAWGLQAATRQAYVAALGNNLALLARALASGQEARQVA